MYGQQYGHYQTGYNNYNPQLNSMAMGTGMPMMIPFSGSTFNNIFFYSGNPIGLKTRLQAIIPEEASSIREANIHCMGSQIKPINLCCIVGTMIAGGFLIFPLCFMCCDWWQKSAYPAFQIPQSVYSSLGRLFSLPNIQSVTLNFMDNKLNSQKCQILYDQLSKSETLKGFTLSNNAGMYDYENNQYSRFQDNMRPIKKLPIVSEIKWGTKLVL